MNQPTKILLAFFMLLVLSCGGRSELKVPKKSSDSPPEGGPPGQQGPGEPLDNIFEELSLSTYQNTGFGYAPFSNAVLNSPERDDLTYEPVLRWELREEIKNQVQQLVLFEVESRVEESVREENVILFIEPTDESLDFSGLSTGQVEQYAIAATDSDGRVSEPVFFEVDTRQRLSLRGWDEENNRGFSLVHDARTNETTSPLTQLDNHADYYFDVLPDGKTLVGALRSRVDNNVGLRMEDIVFVDLDAETEPFSLEESLIGGSIDLIIPTDEDFRLEPRWSPTAEYRVIKTDEFDRPRFYLLRKSNRTTEIKGPFFVGEDMLAWKWSPNGQNLALFMDEGEDFELLIVDPEALMNRGEEAAVIIRSGRIEYERAYGFWSPNSRWFAFTSDELGSLLLADAEELEIQTLVSEGRQVIGAGPFVWSPESEHIGFYEFEQSIGEAPRAYLSIFEAETGDRIFSSEEEEVRAFSFAPDQDIVLFSNFSAEEGAFSFETTNFGERVAGFGFEESFSNVDGAFDFLWSPDASKVAFNGYIGADSPNSVFVADVNDPAGLINLGRTLSSRGFVGDFYWSPDGKWISFVYVNINENPVVQDLYMIRADGSTNLRKISEITEGNQTRRLSIGNHRWLPYSFEIYDPTFLPE